MAHRKSTARKQLLLDTLKTRRVPGGRPMIFWSSNMAGSTTCYNGALGTCTKCGQPHKQLQDGLCRACRQAAERNRPVRVYQYRICLSPGCSQEATAWSNYCDACQVRRRKAYLDGYNARRRWAREGER